MTNDKQQWDTSISGGRTWKWLTQDKSETTTMRSELLGTGTDREKTNGDNWKWERTNNETYKFYMTKSPDRPKLLVRVSVRNVWIRHVPNHWTNTRESTKQLHMRVNYWDGLKDIS